MQDPLHTAVLTTIFFMTTTTRNMVQFSVLLAVKHVTLFFCNFFWGLKEFLPKIFAGGRVFLVKKDCKIKYGFEDPISMLILAYFSCQTTNNVQFCNTLILLNHSNFNINVIVKHLQHVGITWVCSLSQADFQYLRGQKNFQVLVCQGGISKQAGTKSNVTILTTTMDIF